MLLSRLVAAAFVLSAGAVSASAATTVTRGEPSWSWDMYMSKLAPVRALFPRKYPIGINVSREWWTVQVDRAKFTYRVTPVPSSGFNINNMGGQAFAINVDKDADQEIFACGYDPYHPSKGYFVVADFARGQFVGTKWSRIQGCNKIFALKRVGGPPLIALTGVDEGKLPEHTATAEALIYNQATRALVHTGLTMTSHDATQVDFDGDGNDDLVACNWDEPNDGALTFMRNTGTGFTAAPLTPNQIRCMGVEVVDLNGDGQWSVLVTDVGPDPSIGIAGERNQSFRLNPDLSMTSPVELPLPYFERPVFNGLHFEPTWNGNIGRSHDVDMMRGDIDDDGDTDIIMMSGIAWDGNPLSSYQILMNHDGVLVDETDKRMFNEVIARAGDVVSQLRDVNGDGFLDIVQHGGGAVLWQHHEVDLAVTQAVSVYVNDGTGHFVNAIGYQLPWSNTFASMSYAEYAGKPRWVMISQQEPGGQTEVRVAEYSDVLSTGPGLTDPAARGAPGFNEFYYLLKYPDAAKAVRNGRFATGLEHYLRIGRKANRFAFAPGAIVRGSGGADRILLREGDEIAYGLGGNDTMFGQAGGDTLLGGGGVDVLGGGAGPDVLGGGPGKDTFLYQRITDSLPGEANRDLITDFVRSFDKIDVKAVDGNIAPGKQHFTWIGAGVFTGQPGQLGFLQIDLPGAGGDRTIVQGDTDGDLTPDFEIALKGLVALKASDLRL